MYEITVLWRRRGIAGCAFSERTATPMGNLPIATAMTKVLSVKALKWRSLFFSRCTLRYLRGGQVSGSKAEAEPAMRSPLCFSRLTPCGPTEPPPSDFRFSMLSRREEWLEVDR